MVERILDEFRIATELLDLLKCKLFHIRLKLISSSEMREDRSDADRILVLDYRDQQREIFSLEASAVHACVELDVDRIILEIVAFGLIDDSSQELERADLRLKVVFEEMVKRRKHRVEDKDRSLDAGLADLHTLVRESNRDIVNPEMLQSLRHLDRAAAVGRSLHHAHQFSFLLDLRAEIGKIVEQSVEVDFKHSVMRKLLDVVQNAFRLIFRGDFQEDSLMIDAAQEIAYKEIGGRLEKKLIVDFEHRRVGREVRTDKDDAVDSLGLDNALDINPVHLVNKIIAINIRDNKSSAHVLVPGLLLKETQGMFSQGRQILVVTVPDNQTVINTGLSLVPWLHLKIVSGDRLSFSISRKYL